VTIGGGVVLDAAPLKRSSKTHHAASFLEVMRDGPPAEILLARINRRGTQGLSLRTATAETGWTESLLSATVDKLSDKIIRAGERLITSAAFFILLDQAVASVSYFQKSNPLLPGIGREVLRQQMNLHEGTFGAIISRLVHERKLEIAGDQIRLPGTGVVMKDEEAESKKIIEDAFASAGLKVPALKDVLGSLSVDRARAQKIVTLLLRDKVLIKTSEDLVFHHTVLDQLRKRLQIEKAKSTKIDVARFKELTGVSRKYAIPLLEYFDREHITRRVGDARIIV
jgi:selenocysteine-specific elongation factor